MKSGRLKFEPLGDGAANTADDDALTDGTAACQQFSPFADPLPIPVTTPALLTVATKELSDDQDTVRPVRAFPLASNVVAVA